MLALSPHHVIITARLFVLGTLNPRPVTEVFMASFKSWRFALLLPIVLMPACSVVNQSVADIKSVINNQSEAKNQSVVEAAAPAVACDGVEFRGQMVTRGSTITFGHYPQASETPEPIEWIVLDTDCEKQKLLLLSKYVIDNMPLERKRRAGMWAEYTIRIWLNNDFLNAAFSPDEISQIVMTRLETPNYPFSSHLGYSLFHPFKKLEDSGEVFTEVTKDKVFLLSIEDVYDKVDAMQGSGKYFSSDGERLVRATTYAVNKGAAAYSPVKEKMKAIKEKAKDDKIKENAFYYTRMSECAHTQCPVSWWLRSPSTSVLSIGNGYAYAVLIRTDGSIDGTGGFISEHRGIRPALWVSSAPASVSAPLTDDADEEAFFERPASVSAPLTAQSKKGDEVSFGRYPQTSSCAEPLTWIVLDVDKTKNAALLLSKYLIDDREFEEKYAWETITWQNSTIRGWLNMEFVDSAFNEDERLRIYKVEHSTPDSPTSGESGGKPTKDLVFLLSEPEVMNLTDGVEESGRYFSSDKEREAWETPFWVNGNEKYIPWSWWLRSPGNNSNLFAIVRADGSIYSYGEPVTNSNGVRPALWVSLSDAAKPRNTVQSRVAAPKPAAAKADAAASRHIVSTLSAKSKKGDEVSFGSYPQAGSDKEPLTWIVLDVDKKNHAVLLLSKYVIDAMPHYETTLGSYPKRWEYSLIRSWLNSDFIDTAFNEDEKLRIYQVHNDNPEHPASYSEAGNPTEDKVFLLSLFEAMSPTDNVKGSGRYFSGSDERKAVATTYALSRGLYAFHSITSSNKDAIQNCANAQCLATWWLRTPYDSEDFGDFVYVDYGGYIMDDGEREDTAWIGVRPAMWVKY